MSTTFTEIIYFLFQWEEYIFTRVDVEHNERTFRRQLRIDLVHERILNETKQAMNDYTNISVRRWEQLVHKCLQRKRLKSIGNI